MQDKSDCVIIFKFYKFGLNLVKKNISLLIAVFLGLLIASLARVQNFTFQKYTGIPDLYILIGLVVVTFIIVIISRSNRMN